MDVAASGTLPTLHPFFGCSKRNLAWRCVAQRKPCSWMTQRRQARCPGRTTWGFSTLRTPSRTSMRTLLTASTTRHLLRSQVSSQLPLLAAKGNEGGAAFAFASGLALRVREVVITYAAGDTDARALVLPLQKLDALFSASVGGKPLGGLVPT